MKPAPTHVPHTSLKGVSKIMFKFYFTNRALVPEGIRFEERDPAAIDAGHLERAKSSKDGPVVAIRGRQRFNHIDNGINWAKNVESVWGSVCAHFMVVWAGYTLSDIHYYHQPARPKPKGGAAFEKWVVVLTYDLDPENDILQDLRDLEDGSEEQKAAQKLADQIQNLMGFSWGYLYGWNNVNGGAPTVTLNFNHNQGGDKAGENAIVVDGEEMKILPYDEAKALLDQQRARRKRAREEAEAEEEAAPVAA